MQTSGRAVYLDSSALVKLVIRERESVALEAYLVQYPHPISCALVRVEVYRAIWRHEPAAVMRVAQIIDQLTLLELDDRLLERAASIEPPTLRSLDAIHLAAARSVRATLDAMVTYDIRLAMGAQALGLPVIAPGTSPA